MSGQRQLRERAELLAELRDIVQAMKNLAFAELQRVSRERPALAQACEAVLRALWWAEESGPPQEGAPAAPSPATWLVIGAERGFCGAFNARLAAEVEPLLRGAGPPPQVLVASRRLAELLGDGEARFVGLPGCAALEEAPPALESWLAALATAAADGREVWLMHAGADGVRRLRLLPRPDPGAGPGREARPTGPAPMHYLPLPVLRQALRRQALRLLLQAGLYASLEQENHGRLAQMQLAQDHLDALGRTLRRRRAALRQADITNELETLTSSLALSGGPAWGRDAS